MSHKAIYPGTFDPMTKGHLDIIERASSLFPELIVAIGQNRKKQPFLSLENRIASVKEAIKHLPQVRVIHFDGLLVDFMAQEKIRFIVRGIRASSDFEYEFQLAGMNRLLSATVETVFLMPNPDYMFVSSSFVREVLSFGQDPSPYVPSCLMPYLQPVL